jgi:Flp pilus assembly protein TadG
MSTTVNRYLHCLRNLLRFARDARGMAAVEFAIIMPMMLTIFFGTIEVSNGVTVDRKLTLAARTLSDLISQGTKATDTDLDNAFKMGTAILTPYSATPLKQRISAIDIDENGVATVAWTQGSNATGMTSLSKGDVVSIPEALRVNNTQLIMGEVVYTYRPAVGYFMKDGIVLSDTTYTRPRQSLQVDRVTTSTS